MKVGRKSKKSKVGSIHHDPIRYQVSIRGPHASTLSRDAANNLALRALNGDSTPGYAVRIKMWRQGQELDWSPQADEKSEARASVLRANLRRALQSGRVAFRKVGNP